LFLKGIVMNKKRVFDVSTMIIAAFTCVGTELQGMAPAQAGKAAVAVLSDNSAFKEAENIINSASYWWQFKSSVFNAAFRSAREGQVDKAKKEQLGYDQDSVYPPQDEAVTIIPYSTLGYNLQGVFTSKNPPIDEQSFFGKVSPKIIAGLLNTFHLNDDNQPKIPNDPQVLAAIMWPKKHRELLAVPEFPPEFVNRTDRIAGCALSGPFAGYIQRADSSDLEGSKVLYDAALSNNTFKIDLGVLGSITPKDHLMRLGGKAILRHNPDTKQLNTLAIQYTDKTQYTSWFYPSDDKWSKYQDIIMAGMSTDTTVIRHLLNTHMIIAGTISALTNKHFKAQHPLRRFLHPHTAGTLSINNYNIPILLGGKNTMFPALFSFDLENTLNYMQKYVENFQMSKMDIYEDVEKRGMDQLPAGMVYPYAKQGKMFWDFIRQYTTEYVDLYYKNEESITQDLQVQAWYKALTEYIPNGQVESYVNLGASSMLHTNGLKKLLTMFIYTDSIEHYHAGVMTYNYLPWINQVPPHVREDGENIDIGTAQLMANVLLTTMPSHALDLLDGNPFLGTKGDYETEEMIIKERFRGSLIEYRDLINSAEKKESTAAIWPSKVMQSVNS